MKVVVAGASGVLGRPLVGALKRAGHEVVGLTRSAEGAATVQRLGGEGVVADALDRDAVLRAVTAAQPEVVVHLATAIPPKLDPRKIERQFAQTNRLRTQGTDHLLEAAQAAGVQHVVGASLVQYEEGEGLADEDVPFLGGPFEVNAVPLRHLEARVGTAGGTVLRFGHVYGPGSFYAPGGSMHEAVRKRQLPIAGQGGGRFSFVHASDAADATVAAVERMPGGMFNVVDDDPAPPREWIPEYAREIGGKPPWRIPTLFARIGGGPYAVTFLTAMRGASNARAKAALGWQPARPSWRGQLGTAD